MIIGLILILIGFSVVALFKVQVDLENTLLGLGVLFLGGVFFEWGKHIQRKVSKAKGAKQ